MPARPFAACLLGFAVAVLGGAACGSTTPSAGRPAVALGAARAGNEATTGGAARTVTVIIGPGHAAGRRGPSPAEMQALLKQARDPNLPPVVATLNGVPIRAQAVAQAEVLLAESPDPPPAGHAREEAALNMIIRDTLLEDAAVQQGYTSDAATARRELAAGGNPTPSQTQVAREQRALGSLRLQLAVEDQGSGRQRTARLNAYVQRLIARARIVRAPGF